MHVDADKLEIYIYSTNRSVRYKINCHERHKLLVRHFCLQAMWKFLNPWQSSVTVVITPRQVTKPMKKISTSDDLVKANSDMRDTTWHFKSLHELLINVKSICCKTWICDKTPMKTKPNFEPPTLYVHIVVIAGSTKVLCASFSPCPGCVQCTQTHLAVGYTLWVLLCTFWACNGHLAHHQPKTCIT